MSNTSPDERVEGLFKHKVEVSRVWPEGIKLTEPWGKITTEGGTKLNLSKSADGMEVIVRNPATNVTIVCSLQKLIRAMAEACESQKPDEAGNKVPTGH